MCMKTSLLPVYHYKSNQIIFFLYTTLYHNKYIKFLMSQKNRQLSKYFATAHHDLFTTC
jgi:hypothetical protein